MPETWYYILSFTHMYSYGSSCMIFSVAFRYCCEDLNTKLHLITVVTSNKRLISNEILPGLVVKFLIGVQGTVGYSLQQTEHPIKYAHGYAWWRHHMETLSALMAICEGNPSVTGGFPSQKTSNTVTLGLKFSVMLIETNGWTNGRMTDNLRCPEAQVTSA